MKISEHMKYSISLILICFLCITVSAQTQENNLFDKLDSLLIEIRFDSAQEYFITRLNFPVEEEQVILYQKYEYFIESVSDLDSQLNKIDFNKLSGFARSMESSFNEQIVGFKAHYVFKLFQKSLSNSDLKQSYALYLTARFFNNIFYLQERKRLLDDYEQCKSLLNGGEFQQVLVELERFEKQENKQSTAYAQVGDSLEYLYSILYNSVLDSLHSEKMWKPKDIVSPQWNLTLGLQIGLLHRNNKEILYVNYPAQGYQYQVLGHVVDPLAVTVIMQMGFYLSSKILVGIKPFYGLALNRKIDIGDQVTKEYQDNFNSEFYGISLFSRYYFRNKVGARPYLDGGIGLILTSREKIYVSKPHMDPVSGLITEPVYMNAQNWKDAFIDLELGMDISSGNGQSSLYSAAFQLKILLNDDMRIYNTHMGIVLKIGLLLN
jgi:hypothetical protein